MRLAVLVVDGVGHVVGFCCDEWGVLFDDFQLLHVFFGNGGRHFALFYFTDDELGYFLRIGFFVESFIARHAGYAALVDH